MSAVSSTTIAVCGATGRQGGAVVRHLLAQGRRVRALTRKPEGAKARRLAELGAEVVRADMGDRPSLDAAIAGADAVFSVQNPMISGLETEVAQGKNVGDAAAAAGVAHVVYASAGPEPARTGVGSWDSKLEVEQHLRELGFALTVLRPMAFMELMTDKGYYPAFSTWRLMPKLAGSATKLPWLAVDDVGAVTAKAFAERERFAGKTIYLAADVLSLDDCRALWREIRGRSPRGLPMPERVFERVAGADLTAMWRWLRTGSVPLDTGPTREIHPQALTVREWLESHDERRNGDR